MKNLSLTILLLLSTSWLGAMEKSKEIESLIQTDQTENTEHTDNLSKLGDALELEKSEQITDQNNSQNEYKLTPNPRAYIEEYILPRFASISQSDIDGLKAAHEKLTAKLANLVNGERSAKPKVFDKMAEEALKKEIILQTLNDTFEKRKARVVFPDYGTSRELERKLYLLKEALDWELKLDAIQAALDTEKVSRENALDEAAIVNLKKQIAERQATIAALPYLDEQKKKLYHQVQITFADAIKKQKDAERKATQKPTQPQNK